MAEIVVFHHAQGLTPGVEALADALRGGGHLVHVPDLFGGRRFGALDEGLAYVDEIGTGEIARRGVAAVEGLSAELVYLGLSLGVLPAQLLAQTRAGARAALLVHGCVPFAEFSDAWPAAVPVQVHAMNNDPIFTAEGDLDAARELIAEASRAELFLYPGSEHLFTDASLEAYDATATASLVERVLGFVDRLD